MRLFFTNVDKKRSVYEQYVLPYSRLVDLTLSTWRLKTDQNMAARPLTVGGSVWLGTIPNYAWFSEYQTICMIADVRLILK